jgi:hypothetical protein
MQPYPMPYANLPDLLPIPSPTHPIFHLPLPIADLAHSHAAYIFSLLRQLPCFYLRNLFAYIPPYNASLCIYACKNNVTSYLPAEPAG